MKTAEELRLEIAGLVQEYADLKYTRDRITVYG